MKSLQWRKDRSPRDLVRPLKTLTTRKLPDSGGVSRDAPRDDEGALASYRNLLA